MSTNRIGARNKTLAEVAAEDERQISGGYGYGGMTATDAAARGWDAAMEHAATEATQLRAIVKGLANSDPTYESHVGNIFCALCDGTPEEQQLLSRNPPRWTERTTEGHKPSCPWRLAREQTA